MTANLAILKPVSSPKPTFRPEVASPPAEESASARGSSFTEVLNRAEKSVAAKKERPTEDKPVDKPLAKQSQKVEKKNEKAEASESDDAVNTQVLVEGEEVEPVAELPPVEEPVEVVPPVATVTLPADVEAETESEEQPPVLVSPVLSLQHVSKSAEVVPQAVDSTPQKPQGKAPIAIAPQQQSAESAADSVGVVPNPSTSESASDDGLSLQAQTRQATDDAPAPASDASQLAGRFKLELTPQSSSPASPLNQAAPVAPGASGASAPQVNTVTFAHAAPAQSLPMPESDSPQDQANLARVVRGMQGALHQQGGSVTLRLTPPELGTVRIELAIMQGSVTARFHTETESVRQLLTEQLAQLRTGLERQGLHVERLAVQTQQVSMPTHDAQNPSSGGDGRSRGEYAAPQDQRQGDARREAEQGGRENSPRQRFRRELLNAVA